MTANTCVVLVRTQGGLNLGSAARAMANFGFSDLRLVAPTCAVLGAQSRSMALEARPILEDALVFDSLPEAVGDCHSIIGTTRRVGRKRRAELSPRDMAGMLLGADPDRRTAIVFGNEGTGLTCDELDHCNAIVTIRTRGRFDSFNLAQAVLLILYEIERTFQETPPAAATQLERVQELLGHTEPLLRRAGLISGHDPRQVMARLHKIAVRADLNWREWRLLHAAVAHIDKAMDRLQNHD